MAVNSKYMGRTILLTVLALIAVAAASDKPWWDVERTSTSTDSAFVGRQGAELYDDHYLTYHFDSYGNRYDVEYGVYADDSIFTLDPIIKLRTLFSHVSVLSGLWLLAGVLFIVALLIDSQLSSLVVGGFAFAVGAFLLSIFTLEIGAAVANSRIATIIGLTRDVGFTSGYHYDTTIGTVTYTEDVVCGPSLGFFLLFIAFLLQIAAFVLRAYVLSGTFAKDRMLREIDLDSPPPE